MKRLRNCDSCANWVPLSTTKFGECHKDFESVTGKARWTQTQGDQPGCAAHTLGYEDSDDGKADDAGQGTAHHLPDHGVSNADQSGKVAKRKVGKS